MNKLRKIFTASVMVMTLAVMLGFGSFAHAATPQAGDLIKMDGLSTVYFLGNDSKRYVFPHESVFFSWHRDFSGVVTVSASELQSYPLGANITMRPGTKLVKITTDPSVYAVEPNGVLRKIQSESDAIAIYGPNWNKRVVDVADSFFTNYTIGKPLASGEIAAGTLVKNADDATVYYFDGTNYRPVASESAFYANRFSFNDVITISKEITPKANAISNNEFAYDPQNATGPVTTASGVTVSLSSATPAAASIPKSVGVPFTKLNLTAASDGNVSVNSITVKRIGLSDYEDIDKVWAEQNGTIVASKKSMNSNDESILVFSPALTIPAGKTVGIDLFASLDSSAKSGNIGLSVASASAVGATAAAVYGSFPINGNLMTPTNYEVTGIKIDNGVSTVTNLNIGDENVQLGNFDVAYSTSSRDIVLKSVMFRNTGIEDMDKVLMNVYLENNGKKVADGAISGKYITFTFNNGGLTMLKDDGDQKFNIKGDVIAKEDAGTSESITLALDKVENIVANEAANGFGVTVAASSETVNVARVKIQAGIVSVSKKSTSPADATVIKGTRNITTLLANVKADEAINAEGLVVNVEQTNNDAFENVKVYLNNILLDSFDPTTVGTTTIDSNFSLNKGDNEIKITVDVKSNATTTDANFKVSLNTSGAPLLDTPEYASTGNAVGSNDITGTASGAKITVGGASFSAIRSDGYGDRNVVIGTSGISLGKVTVKATNDNVKITNINVASTTGNTIPASSLYDMKIFVDGSQVGSTRNFTSTGASFSSLAINVADNQTKTIELFGSIDSAATGTIVTKMSFVVEDSLGKTVEVTDEPTTAKFTVVGSGTLTIEKDGNSPVGGILVSKAGLEQEVAQFKLTATNDSANLTELVINNSGATTTDPRIASYKLYVEGNSTAVDTMVPFEGEAKFIINNNAIVVPADGSKKITIKAVLNDIYNDETATDAPLQVKVKSYKFKSSNGDETSTDEYYAGVSANQFRIRKTAPTITLLPLPNTTLTSGSPVVAKFQIAADTNADVKVGRIALKYTATASTTLSTSTSPVKINGVAKSDNVTSEIDTTKGYIHVDFGTTTPEIVSAGTSKTFEVVVNATITGSERETVTTSILEASYASGGLVLIDGSLTWSDSASNTDSKNKWFNSWRVKGLPSDTQTMTTN